MLILRLRYVKLHDPKLLRVASSVSVSSLIPLPRSSGIKCSFGKIARGVFQLMQLSDPALLGQELYVLIEEAPKVTEMQTFRREDSCPEYPTGVISFSKHGNAK